MRVSLEVRAIPSITADKTPLWGLFVNDRLVEVFRSRTAALASIPDYQQE